MANETDSGAVTDVVALKTKDAAYRLSVSEATLRRLVARGLIRANRGTRHMLFSLDELDRFLKQ